VELFVGALTTSGNVIHNSLDGKIWTQRTFPGAAITATGLAPIGTIVMLGEYE